MIPPSPPPTTQPPPLLTPFTTCRNSNESRPGDSINPLGLTRGPEPSWPYEPPYLNSPAVSRTPNLQDYGTWNWPANTKTTKGLLRNPRRYTVKIRKNGEIRKYTWQLWLSERNRVLTARLGRASTGGTPRDTCKDSPGASSRVSRHTPYSNLNHSCWQLIGKLRFFTPKQKYT